ncbi:MAG TPA: zf-HC2 domain-containing protein [Candidatus Binatia bacterium]|nr:zf-HC2 domain-containing protein [Candidatus Binatia bacterium]
MVSCKTIIANLTNYLDGDASPEMRQKIEKHLRHCHRCTAVYDSTRKMLVITGDERVFEIPAGYSERLHTFLDNAMAKGSTN